MGLWLSGTQTDPVLILALRPYTMKLPELTFAVQHILGCVALLYTCHPPARLNAPNRPWRDYTTRYGNPKKFWECVLQFLAKITRVWQQKGRRQGFAKPLTAGLARTGNRKYPK
jgi:hypothetical protein